MTKIDYNGDVDLSSMPQELGKKYTISSKDKKICIKANLLGYGIGFGHKRTFCMFEYKSKKNQNKQIELNESDFILTRREIIVNSRILEEKLR